MNDDHAGHDHGTYDHAGHDHGKDDHAGHDRAAGAGAKPAGVRAAPAKDAHADDDHAGHDHVDKRCTISMRGSFGACVVQTRDGDFFIGAERALELCERSLERASSGRRWERTSLRSGFREAA